MNDVTATRVNQSVKFNASDGRTLDIGDDEDAAQSDDNKSNSEEGKYRLVQISFAFNFSF